MSKASVLEFWRQASPRLRSLAKIMWSVGLIIFVVSVVLDTQQLWASLPFLTNMVSAAVGALFGIPIALLVLQQLAGQEAERIERRSIARSVQRSCERLAVEAQRVFGETPSHTKLSRAIRDYSAAGVEFPGNGTLLSLPPQHQALYYSVTELWHQGAMDRSALQNGISRLQAEWSYFLANTRPKLDEWELTTLDHADLQEFGELVRKMDNLMRDDGVWEYYYAKSEWDRWVAFGKDGRKYSIDGQEELLRWLPNSAEFLQDLIHCVEGVIALSQSFKEAASRIDT